MKSETKEYLVSLASGTPDWKTSKWVIKAETKSQALHFALLLHDDTEKWPVSMVTISYKDANPKTTPILDNFNVANPDRVYRLDRIYQHGKERLENC